MRNPWVVACIASAALVEAAAQSAPAWRALPVVEPAGTRDSTGSFVVADRAAAKWTRPAVVYDEKACTGRKRSNVAVLIYDPVLEAEGGKRLTEWLDARDPVEYSHVLANVVREASWGYVNHEIVDVIRVDGFPIKADGFRYTDDSFLEVRKTQQWQPSTSSYRAMLEENGLLARVQRRCASRTATRASARPTTRGSTVPTTSRPSAAARSG